MTLRKKTISDINCGNRKFHSMLTKHGVYVTLL